MVLSFLSRDPLAGFAYELGPKVEGFGERSIWSLHDGKKKAGGERVSVFVFNMKECGSVNMSEMVKAAHKRTKTLRHPNILSYIDGIDTDKVVYIVTKYVQPLSVYLSNTADSNEQKLMAISWGLHQICKAVTFLNKDCQLVHGNICEECVFVDDDGEWKLGCFEYMYPYVGEGSQASLKLLSIQEVYNPPEMADVIRGQKYQPWSTDMWGLGCLMWEVFNGRLTQKSDLKNYGKMPKQWSEAYVTVLKGNPSARPNPQQFITGNMSRANGIFNNKFIQSMLILEELQVKSEDERTRFFRQLPAQLDSFPSLICNSKVLKCIVQGFDIGQCNHIALTSLLKIGKGLDAADFQSKVVPCIVKQFGSKNRAIRMTLITEMKNYIEYVPVELVNANIYPTVAKGFQDNVPAVREATVRAIAILASRLNYNNLNQDVMQHFARLQAQDSEGIIRCNTTICIGKLAPYMHPQSRQKILVSAFSRALRDQDPAVRSAGILGFLGTAPYHIMKDVACKILPALSPMLLDPNKVVRESAFKTVRSFMEKLESVSENPEKLEELEAQVNSGPSTDFGIYSAWTSWASSLTTKFYAKKPVDSAGAGTGGVKQAVSPVNDGVKAMAIGSSARVSVSSHTGGEVDVAGGNGSGRLVEGSGDVAARSGWDAEQWVALDDDDDETTAPEATGWDEFNDDEGHEELEGIDDVPPNAATTADAGDWGSSTMGTGNANVNNDDFFNTLITSAPQPRHGKPAAPATALDSGHKLAASTVASDKSGWDEWGSDTGWDEWGGGTSAPTSSSSSRDAKRAERQAALQARRAAKQAAGPMKLGGKRL